MRPDRVLASAVVDPVFEGQTRGMWRVTVWGQPPHDQRRVYSIAAKSDTLAAQEGIDRFVAEMQQDGAGTRH